MEKKDTYGWDKFAVVAVPVMVLCFVWLRQRGRPTPGILFLEFIMLTTGLWWWDRRRKSTAENVVLKSKSVIESPKKLVGLALVVMGTILSTLHIPMNTSLGALFTITGVILFFGVF